MSFDFEGCSYWHILGVAIKDLDLIFYCLKIRVFTDIKDLDFVYCPGI